MENKSAFFPIGFTSLLHIFYCQVRNKFQADQTSVSYLNVYLLIFISLKGSYFHLYESEDFNIIYTWHHEIA